jgi:hypothetical protein
VNASNAVIEESLANVGAEIMGRGKFGGGPGPWGDDPWSGWWGEEPPFHMPVFVLTHHEREPLTLSAGAKASSKRPPESRSRLAAARAITAGGRSGRLSTFADTRTVSVCAATHDSNVHVSRKAGW